MLCNLQVVMIFVTFMLECVFDTNIMRNNYLTKLFVRRSFKYVKEDIYNRLAEGVSTHGRVYMWAGIFCLINK